MNLVQTTLPGVVILEADVRRDSRGFFLESYNQRRFAELGIHYTFVQDNHSRSGANVLRGLHYQDMTAPLAKLVRCTAGAIFDVAVDLRVGSATFGKWVGVELSAGNMRQLLIPEGFGHGFATLTDGAELQYKCSGFYAPASEGAVRWDDPDLAIDWPVSDPLVSARDAAAESLQDYLKHPRFMLKDMQQA